jgi:hypothetical protein
VALLCMLCLQATEALAWSNGNRPVQPAAENGQEAQQQSGDSKAAADPHGQDMDGDPHGADSERSAEDGEEAQQKSNDSKAADSDGQDIDAELDESKSEPDPAIDEESMTEEQVLEQKLMLDLDDD